MYLRLRKRFDLVWIRVVVDGFGCMISCGIIGEDAWAIL